MSLSSCEKCWETPCACGYGYRKYSKYGRIALAAVVLGVEVDKLTLAIKDIIEENHPMKNEK